MAEWMPYARASYVQDATTPRSPAPPTITGLPARLGSTRTSTDAKKLSMSTWRIVGSPRAASEPDDVERLPRRPFDAVLERALVRPPLDQPGDERFVGRQPGRRQLGPTVAHREEAGVDHDAVGIVDEQLALVGGRPVHLDPQEPPGLVGSRLHRPHGP